METIKVNNKTYEIKHDRHCVDCMFYYYDRCTAKGIGLNCIIQDYHFVREIGLFERIKLWLKKKIKL